MKISLLALIALPSILIAGEATIQSPSTREAVARVSVVRWSNGDVTQTVRDPVYRQPVIILEKNSFGVTVRDPVTREKTVIVK